jgi:hypothetical protein
MSTSRKHLHFDHLDKFAKFCSSHGWLELDLYGDGEVLRMRHPKEKGVLTVFAKQNATQHFTTWGHSERMAKKFYRQKGVV